jgi:hypothetical protein
MRILWDQAKPSCEHGCTYGVFDQRLVWGYLSRILPGQLKDHYASALAIKDENAIRRQTKLKQKINWKRSGPSNVETRNVVRQGGGGGGAAAAAAAAAEDFDMHWRAELTPKWLRVSLARTEDRQFDGHTITNALNL